MRKINTFILTCISQSILVQNNFKQHTYNFSVTHKNWQWVNCLTKICRKTKRFKLYWPLTNMNGSNIFKWSFKTTPQATVNNQKHCPCNYFHRRNDRFAQHVVSVWKYSPRLCSKHRRAKSCACAYVIQFWHLCMIKRRLLLGGELKFYVCLGKLWETNLYVFKLYLKSVPLKFEVSDSSKASLDLNR